MVAYRRRHYRDAMGLLHHREAVRRRRNRVDRFVRRQLARAIALLEQSRLARGDVARQLYGDAEQIIEDTIVYAEQNRCFSLARQIRERHLRNMST